MTAKPSSIEELEAQTASRLLSFLTLVAAYLGLNSSLNLLNKWSLGVYGFRFPFLLTTCHMAFSFMVLAPVALMQPWHVHRRTLQRQWKGVVCIGCLMAFNIVLNNASLMGISLTLNQIIRSAMPVVTCGIAIVVENKLPTRQELTSLIVLSVGVMLAVWQGTLSGTPYAIIFCASSVVSCATTMTLSARVMSEKLDVVRLTFYTAPVSLLCLIPPAYFYEREAFMAYLPHHYSGVLFIVGISSINAVAYNLVHAKMIKDTSAVTTTVLGEVKIVGLLVLSALILGESKEFTLKLTLGCVLAMVGFAMYSHTKIVNFRVQLQPVAPVQVNLTANGTSPSAVEVSAPESVGKIKYDDGQRPVMTMAVIRL